MSKYDLTVVDVDLVINFSVRSGYLNSGASGAVIGIFTEYSCSTMHQLAVSSMSKSHST